MRERTKLPSDVISSLSNLRLLLTSGARNTAMDVEACSKHGVVVVGTGGIGRPTHPITQARPPTAMDSTMEHTWTLILGLARNIARDDAAVKAGGWGQSYATGLK